MRVIKQKIRILAVPIFFVGIFSDALLAQINVLSGKTVYVWDFTTRDGETEALTVTLTEVFEEALVKTRQCKVLNRRDPDRLIVQKQTEKKIMSLEQVEKPAIDTLKSRQADVVIFGEIYNDPNAGLLKISISAQSFDYIILAKESVFLPLGKKDDPESQEIAMKELVENLFPNQQDITGISPNQLSVIKRNGGLRSLAPGFGQFHKQQYKKGWAFIILESAFFLTAYAALDYSNSAHDKAVNASTQGERDDYNDISTNYGRLSNISWILLGITHVVNMVDGFSSTEIKTTSNLNSIQWFSYSFAKNEYKFFLTFRLNF